MFFPFFVALGVLGCLLYLIIKSQFPFKAKHELIPGPPITPFLGNTFQLMNSIKSNLYPFTPFAKKYGEICSLKLPFTEIVILGSLEAVINILSKEESYGRDLSGILLDRNYSQNLGIILSHGKMWEKSRKWAVRSLRDFGFGKTTFLENAINQEIAAVFSKIKILEDVNGQSILAVDKTFLVPVTRIVYKMIAGEDSEIDEDYLIELNNLTLLMEKASGMTGTTGGALAIYFPFIRYIFPNWTGRTIQLKCRDEFAKESRKLLRQAKQKIFDGETIQQPETFTEMFASKMKDEEKTKKKSGIFEDLNYDLIFTDLFQASSNTTSGYMEALILYMILYPDVQEKVCCEIKETLSSESEITFQDKPRLIYTQATLLETHRVAKINQYLVPRKALKDFTYKDYLIKKDSLILADMNAVNMDEKVFEDPNSFKPERFVDLNGNLCNQKLVIPFGVSKRICPGEILADVATFLMFTNLIRKYKFSILPGEPNKPSAVMRIGINSCPYPFSVLVTKRD